MAKIDVKLFEKKIRVRQLRPVDYAAVTGLQRRCFPGMEPWTKEQYTSLLSTFPEGQICVTHSHRIVGSCSSLVLNFDEYGATDSWARITGHGYISNHNPAGDTLYGIEIMVDPEFRGMKLSRRLYEARKTLARKMNLRRIVLGGRIPGYHKYADAMTATEYTDRVRDKRIYDPVLTPQISNGFVLKRLIPEYLPTDTDSRGYATFLEWPNVEYKIDRGRQETASPYVRVCALQYMMRIVSSFDEFARQCEYFIDVASDYRCDFILFPEIFTTQLLSFIKPNRPAMAMRSLSAFTPKYLELFTNLAIKHNINIIGGSHLTVEDGNLYNIAFLFRRDGTIGKQYKIHITPSERKWWGVKAGDSVEVFDTDRGKVAILICYDIEFPELARIAVQKGAKIIFVPFNTDERRSYLRVRYCAHARCIENQIYVAIAGCVGNLPSVENLDIHYAQSAILTPSDIPFQRDGIAAECPANIETMIFQDLDINLLQRQRTDGTVHTWQDRRTELYRILYRDYYLNESGGETGKTGN